MKRSLGAAILAAALEDYLGSDAQARANAEKFLYPRDQEYREHYQWVVGMAPGVNPAWLRDSLDRLRARLGCARRPIELPPPRLGPAPAGEAERS